MSLSQTLENELDELIQDGENLKVGTPEFKSDYESWYTEARRVIKLVIPERVESFDNLYEARDRKGLSNITYSICDYLLDRELPTGLAQNRTFNATIPNVVEKRFYQQVSILKSAKKAFTRKLINISHFVQYDIYDNEIEAARELLDKGFIRASGVIAGVVLEGHLKSLCQSKGITISKAKPTFSDFNDALKANGDFDTAYWRKVSALGDLRNKCAHKKDEEPTEANAKDLIDGTESVINA